MSLTDRIQMVNTGLTELAQPYLGSREYGSPIILGVAPNAPNTFPSIYAPAFVTWHVSYQKLAFFDDVLQGTASAVIASLDLKSGKFKFSRGEGRDAVTENPQDVVAYFREMLGSIPTERWTVLLAHAVARKSEGIPPETAIAEVRRFADGHPDYAPSQREIGYYEEYYKKPLTKGWV